MGRTLRPFILLCLHAACVAFSIVGVTSFMRGGGVQGVTPLKQQQEEAVQALGPGEIVRRSMNSGESHSFRLPLRQGQFAQFMAEQKGVDVGLKIIGPDGKPVAEMDSPNGLYGLEVLSVIAQVSGDYTVALTPETVAAGGAYELRVEGPRDATSDDERRIEAERTYVEAQRLRREPSADARTRAVEKYKAARDIWRALGDQRGEGYALCGAGRAYRALGKLTEALDYMGQALSRLQDARDVSGQAFVLNEVGATYRNLDDPLKALESYARALELRNSIGDVWGQAQLHNNIGLVYSNAGQQHKAIENYGRALPLWRAAGDRPMEANTLNNVALAYTDISDLFSALNNFREVLKFCQEANDIRLEAHVQNNIGRIYTTWGESQTALTHYDQALQIFRKLENRDGEALTLNNIGMVYAELGDPARALTYFDEALSIGQQLKEPRGMAITLTNAAYAYTLQEKHLEALKRLDEALPLSRAVRNKPFEAYALLQMGMIYYSLRDPRKALEYYRQALDIQNEIKDPRGQAIALDKIGQAEAALGELSKALGDYKQALERWVAAGDKQGQALTLYGIARVERDRVNLREAAERVEQAIGIVEALRTKMTGYQLRLNYLAAKQDYYELDVDVRMRLYEQVRSEADLEAALSASEQARARVLLDALGEALADNRIQAAPQLAMRSQQLEHEIDALAQSLLRLRAQNRTEDAAAVESRLGKLIAESDDLEARIRAASPSYAALKLPRPLEARAVRQLLDPDTLLVEYALGDDRSYVWVVSRDRIEPHALPGRAEIEKLALQLRESLAAYEGPARGEGSLQYLKRLKSAGEQLRRQSAALGGMLLGPLASRMEGKRLVIVADGALRYIPFEMLTADAPANGQATQGEPAPSSLITKHEVIYLPSASALTLLRSTPRRKESGAVAVLADPVFDVNDARVRVASATRKAEAETRPLAADLGRALRDIGDTGELRLERLRHSAEEADSIVAAAPRGSTMKATDFNASRATATSQALRQYNIVHFATHGILNDKHPELSGIILSMVNERGEPQDGYLRLRDIYNLDLPVDLVVLSACRTGVGRQMRGEGLMSLTRGFMHAGASKVVASLWKVEDEATAELMKRFYHYVLEKRLPAAAALRQAKLEMMAAREQWRSPFYWAGFVIQGDWK